MQRQCQSACRISRFAFQSPTRVLCPGCPAPSLPVARDLPAAANQTTFAYLDIEFSLNVVSSLVTNVETVTETITEELLNAVTHASSSFNLALNASSQAAGAADASPASTAWPSSSVNHSSRTCTRQSGLISATRSA